MKIPKDNEALGEFSLLVVEDDPGAQEAIRELLGERVRKYRQAFDGEEGLSLYRQCKPDIILTDINLPKMDGLTMAQKIKKEENSVPILVMSAFDQREILLRAIEIGIDAFIVKPVDTTQLCRKLGEVAENLRKIRYAEEALDARLRDLERKAHYDPVTRLPNRLHFDRELGKALLHTDGNEEKLALYLIDLDNFKQINDRYGHPVGDKVLRLFSDSLSRTIRHGDLLARIGGDEFALIAGGLHRTECAETLGRKLLDAGTFKVKHRHGEISVGCSIGAALYPKDARNLRELLERADKALYRVKASGKAGYHIFT